jgi:hypothetical protein
MTGPRQAHGGGRTGGAKKVKRRPRQVKPEECGKPAFREKPKRPRFGLDAALEEWTAFNAAGMLAQWRERWRHVLKR